MEENTICSVCHVSVRPTDFFCYNCGKNLQEKPLSTSPVREILYYAGSIFLPPLGLWWGIKYLRQPDLKSKRIGWISIILTFASVLITVAWTVNFINGVTSQVNSQLNGIPGL